MAKLNITQAAKAVGLHRSTLQRHIKQGKVSCTSDGDAGKVIDTAELIRVYGDIKEPATPATVAPDVAIRQDTTPHATAIFELKINALEKENESLVEQLERERSDVTELKAELQEERTERRQAQRLLEDKREKEEQPQPLLESRLLMGALIPIALIGWLLVMLIKLNVF